MGFIEESDVRQMLSDETLVDEIITALVSDPGVLKELAHDIFAKEIVFMSENIHVI